LHGLEKHGESPYFRGAAGEMSLAGTQAKAGIAFFGKLLK